MGSWSLVMLMSSERKKNKTLFPVEENSYCFPYKSWSSFASFEDEETLLFSLRAQDFPFYLLFYPSLCLQCLM